MVGPDSRDLGVVARSWVKRAAAAISLGALALVGAIAVAGPGRGNHPAGLFSRACPRRVVARARPRRQTRPLRFGTPARCSALGSRPSSILPSRPRRLRLISIREVRRHRRGRAPLIRPTFAWAMPAHLQLRDLSNHSHPVHQPGEIPMTKIAYAPTARQLTMFAGQLDEQREFRLEQITRLSRAAATRRSTNYCCSAPARRWPRSRPPAPAWPTAPTAAASNVACSCRSSGSRSCRKWLAACLATGPRLGDT